MKLNNVELNNYQLNFLKDLMGDQYMTEVRVQSRFNLLCQKYDIDVEALAAAINKNFAIKNEEFKKKEAAELES